MAVDVDVLKADLLAKLERKMKARDRILELYRRTGAFDLKFSLDCAAREIDMLKKKIRKIDPNW